MIGIVIGAVIGAINGLITTVARVPSLVVTLAALYIVRGIDAQLVNGSIVDPSQVPSAFTAVGYKTILGVPWLAIIVAVVVAVVGYAMRSFRSSRELYAIGSNPEAAALAGIPTGRRVFAAFVISGALAGLGGALFLAQFAQVDSTAGSATSSWSIAAVVVGGVAIFGGSGTVVGRGAGRAAAEHDQPGAGRGPGARRSGTRRSPARCCSPRSPSTAGCRCASRAACALPRGRTVMSETASTPTGAGTARPRPAGPAGPASGGRSGVRRSAGRARSSSCSSRTLIVRQLASRRTSPARRRCSTSASTWARSPSWRCR